ncbi:MAG TPA: hypothetical protein DCE41_29475 [Cytophagales bacterium]|nr:hypothetical protein [Cytophagales bacterium]HAA18565.1 hypothetical protein [Cytophagales bacterium]HAP60206.1 hypothetical protein [Cytophagales bacterium]
MENVKSFTFKVAKTTESNKEVKVREGVAMAGCSLVETPWGREPKSRWNPYPWQTGDNGYWC